MEKILAHLPLLSRGLIDGVTALYRPRSVVGFLAGSSAVGLRPRPSGTRCSGRGSPPCADLDQLLLEGGQRPITHRFRRRQRPQEVGEVVGKRMKRIGRAARVAPQITSCTGAAIQGNPTDAAPLSIERRNKAK
jgi:hypothetical protein